MTGKDRKALWYGEAAREVLGSGKAWRGMESTAALQGTLGNCLEWLGLVGT